MAELIAERGCTSLHVEWSMEVASRFAPRQLEPAKSVRAMPHVERVLAVANSFMWRLSMMRQRWAPDRMVVAPILTSNGDWR
ncbi:hypothetical protein HUA76_07275 [Myxococcus sp. CA056]|uniref:hypothetical protein n=1 Tax=Myxococcus sp. CA056 TaxID=2741740 RepID=UPI00157A8B96|nr:hypothetical protein [Myxococcus sp. CA056]NTX10583.1 hypothetical protein [Myxococcus sp. CA056]